MDITRELDRAKAELFRNSQLAFLTAIFMQLKFQFTEKIPTAAVDGVHLFFNQEFFIKLSLEERVGVLMHEVMHIALSHISRKNARDPVTWNVAGDHVINLWLNEHGITLPSGALCDTQFTNMLTEEVYNYLIENPDEVPQDPKYQDVLDSGMSAENTQAAIDEILVRARTQADVMTSVDSIGAMPGDIKRFFEQFDKPKLPWTSILREFINTTCKKQFTMKKPNRRHLPNGFYLPTRSGKGMDKLTFCIDVSGSISEKTFTSFVSEVAAVMKSVEPKEIVVTQFDTSLVGKTIVSDINDIRSIKFKGGGGTDILEAIEDFAKHDTVAMVMLTDGYFHTGHVPNPNKPVMWIVYDNPGFIPPFGKAIHFDLESIVN